MQGDEDKADDLDSRYPPSEPEPDRRANWVMAAHWIASRASDPALMQKAFDDIAAAITRVEANTSVEEFQTFHMAVEVLVEDSRLIIVDLEDLENASDLN